MFYLLAKFNLVALGGTFDIVHKGHLSLLKKAFSISSKVIIGLTSDELAAKRGKKVLNDYSKRKEMLEKIIHENFAGSDFEISKLDNEFGPAVLEGDVEALVVSEETEYQGDRLNKLRQERNLPKVDVIVVPMVLADDGIRISTTRIKNAEITQEGEEKKQLQ